MSEIQIDSAKEQTNAEQRAGDKQHTENTERGTYRQYEDQQTIIDKIRSYRSESYPDSEIMKMLDNMPRRTFYNYVKKMREQDKEIIENSLLEYADSLAEEYLAFRENTCRTLRQLQAIIDSANTPSKDKLKAMQMFVALCEKQAAVSRELRDGIGASFYNRKQREEEEKLREEWAKKFANPGAAKSEA